MAVMNERFAVPMPKPRVSPADPGGAIRYVHERSDTGLDSWIRELHACRRLIVLSLTLAVLATFVDYSCGVYVSSIKSVKVPDLILDHLEPIDMGFLFVYGYAALIAVMFLYPLIFRVRIFHVVAIQFSLLLMLRSLFMIFTHVETPADSVPVTFPWFFQNLYFENDMFFSGHTAMPFLGFYLFKQSPLRYVFLVGAVVMGITALAMHLHYTIDVIAAYFMTYCSYRIGRTVTRRLDPTCLE